MSNSERVTDADLASVDVEAEVAKWARAARETFEAFGAEHVDEPGDPHAWQAAVRPLVTALAQARREIERLREVEAIRVGEIEGVLDKHRAAFGVELPQVPRRDSAPRTHDTDGLQRVEGRGWVESRPDQRNLPPVCDDLPRRTGDHDRDAS